MGQSGQVCNPPSASSAAAAESFSSLLYTDAAGATEQNAATPNSGLTIAEDSFGQLISENLDVTAQDISLELILRPPQFISGPTRAKEWNYVSRIIASHLTYAISQIKDAPKLMVYESCLPWCHPTLYRDHMPQCMEDAVSSCALYIARNATNTSMILRCIENRLRELLDAPEPTLPLECLAKTQALLLYNIIGTFSGDIRVQSTVGGTRAALQNSASSLLAFTTFEELDEAPGHESLTLYPLTDTRQFWESWVFMESARRTFLITIYFMQLYLVIIGNPSVVCSARQYLGASWMISESLWGASNPVGFALAWREGKYFVAKVGQFNDLIDGGKAEYVDDFAKILLSSLMGVDEFRGWMIAQGRSI